MKKFYVVGLVALSMIAMVSCGNKAAKKEVAAKPKADSAVVAKPTVAVDSTKKSVDLGEVKGYFFAGTPKTAMTMVYADKAAFAKNFHPAATMKKGSVTTVDFKTTKVGAVALPKTNKVGDFKLVDSYLTPDSVLHVTLTYAKDAKKTTFSIVPAYTFSFKSDLNVKCVAFDVDGNVTKVEVK